MKIRVAGSAGFCYGVRRAVELAEKATARGPVYLLGHITHNDHVIRRLEDMGAATVSSPEEVPLGETVLIRAHGEPDSTFRALEARGIPCEPIRWDPYTESRMTFFHDPDGLPLELHE